jgi:hypothetical protein
VRERPFNFEMQMVAFEKADAPAGKQRRIGGVVSTASKDLQDEQIIQRGLDFSHFVKHGWFNDNHSKKTSDILGYPETTKFCRKGSTLPDGTTAKTDCHWTEGYLLPDYKPANEVWELAQSLAKTNRKLGFSVEGKILRREGPDNKVIAEALVRNVAITNCPVNTDSRLEILAKSLLAVEASEADDGEDLDRALAAGPVDAANPGPLPAGPQEGPTAGRLLAPRSLEHGVGRKKKKLRRTCDADANKSLTQGEAEQWVRARLPQASENQVGRVIRLARALHARS